MRHGFKLAIACGASLLLATPPALAGTLQVNPVLLDIDASRRTASVTVRNEEGVPVTIRAYPLAWRQADGEDIYEDTAAVIVSPPVSTIAPGGTQMIRVGLRAPSSAPQAYRLIIEEVPEANPEGGIRIALRLNLPLYATMRPGDEGALRWSASRQPDGTWVVEAANSGSGYVRLDAAAAGRATGIAFDDLVAFGTVLPGAARRWQVGNNPEIRDRSRFQTIAGAQARGVAAAGRD